MWMRTAKSKLGGTPTFELLSSSTVMSALLVSIPLATSFALPSEVNFLPLVAENWALA